MSTVAKEIKQRLSDAGGATMARSGRPAGKGHDVTITGDAFVTSKVGQRRRSFWLDEAVGRLQTDGGFSVNHYGAQPRSGGMASVVGMEAELPGIPSKGQIKHWANTPEVYEALKVPGRYLGGWHDKEANKTYLDVSQRWPTTQAADLAGHANSQISTYHVNTGNVQYMADTQPPLPGLLPMNEVPDRPKRRRAEQFMGELARRSAPSAFPTRPSSQGRLFS